MVVLVQEGPEAHVDIVQAGDLAEVVQAPFPQRAPEALHLPARGRVIGSSVQQGNAQTSTGHAEDVSAVGRPVVQVEGTGRWVLAECTHPDPEHVDLALLVVGLQGGHVP